MFVYTYIKKNDGEPSVYSPEQLALMQAFGAFYDGGGFEWDEITIEKIACDDPSHYPDLCWHFNVYIDNGEPA